MTPQHGWPAAIIGWGNIGTDLMIKILRGDGPLSVTAMVGIDPESDGLARAAHMGVPTTSDGIEGPSQMSQEPFGEGLGMLPMHEMPASDFLNDVLVLEHPGGAPIVRWLDDWIIEPRKDHHWYRDPHLQ